MTDYMAPNLHQWNAIMEPHVSKGFYMTKYDISQTGPKIILRLCCRRVQVGCSDRIDDGALNNPIEVIKE